MSKTSNPQRPDRYRLPGDIDLPEFMEALRIENDVVNKIVSYLADDMFLWWREFDGLSDVTQKMMDAEGRHRIRNKLSQVLKIARLHGTGLLVMLTREASPDQPLDIDAIRPGDLANILVLSKYDAISYPEMKGDPIDPRIARCGAYEIMLKGSKLMTVHPSRVIRFDGISPVEQSRPNAYPKTWGFSVLVRPILTTLGLLDEQEAIGGLIGSATNLEPGADQILSYLLSTGERLNDDRPDDAQIDISAYHRCDLANLESIEHQLLANIRNSPELLKLLNRSNSRDQLIAVSDVPATRMRRIGPVVMNGSTSRDEWSYAAQIAKLQTRLLTAPLRRLDLVIARDIGLDVAPNYKFKPLVYLSSLEEAQSAKSLVDEVGVAFNAGDVDRKEARRRLRTHPMFTKLLVD